MSNHDWDAMNEQDFDFLLENSLAEIPPEDIVEGVTPWKRAINRILVGMALSAVTLNFLCLNYILPAIGMVLSILGFRALYRENKWFRLCFIITAIRSIYFFLTLILNTTIIQGALYSSSAMSVLNILNLALIFLLFFCFKGGLEEVREKAGLSPKAGGATMLIVWYALLCLLAFVHYSGLIITGAMVIAYIFIIRSLFRLSGELDEAGYAIRAIPVKITDRTIVLGIIILLLIGCICGYVFGGSYPMEWTAVDTAEHSEVEDIKAHLTVLGFPEDILDDISAEDIAACEGALEVLVDVCDFPVNDGREVTVYREADPILGIHEGIYHTVVYDVKELRITGIAVKLPGEREQWKIFHHFQWTTDPGFYGTESIQLWPAYRNGNGWGSAGDVTGRVLYDNGGQTYTSPYYSLGDETFTSESIFWGTQTSTDIFATFSMPNSGENHRGYVSYPIIEMQDGWITDCWINYTHQQSWLQYPAVTAMEKRMSGGWSSDDPFKTVQDALQFYSTDSGVDLIN